MAPDMKLCG